MSTVLELYDYFGYFADSNKFSDKKVSSQWSERYAKLTSCCNKFDHYHECPAEFLNGAISYIRPSSSRKVNTNVCPLGLLVIKQTSGASLFCTEIKSDYWRDMINTIDSELLTTLLPMMDKWLTEVSNA